MHEKMALDLVEGSICCGFRNEQGIYYEDLYDLIKPLHDHYHLSALSIPLQQALFSPTEPGAYGTFATAASTLRATSHASKNPPNPLSVSASTPQILALSDPATAVFTNAASCSTVLQTSENPSLVSLADAHTPLLPASNPGPEGSAPFRRVAPDIIPFVGLFASLRRAFRSNSTAPDTPADATGEERDHRRTWRGLIHLENNACRRWKATRERNALNARVARLVYERHDLEALAELRRDNQPDDEAGENLPTEILICLSEWVAVLEERGSAPSTTISSIIGGIQALEISLTLTEQVLTTPLPFVYSVHIRILISHSFVVLSTMPALCHSLSHVGAFVYLGFVAAGEEREQPFGYDDNDLDLDLLCRDIVRRGHPVPQAHALRKCLAWAARARVGLDYHRETEAEMRAVARAEDKTLAFTAARIHILPTVDAPVWMLWTHLVCNHERLTRIPRRSRGIIGYSFRSKRKGLEV
ncbi:hypothetical protein C8J57DRAFT_1470073 [Mycena rebaudengoi]|nr:hypothetical protein C8J57DRAFT_1470073 [Mycena rebaudengoi]